jgi:hypothetical protein
MMSNAMMSNDQLQTIIGNNELCQDDPAPAACARSHFFSVIASFLPYDIKDRAKHDRINHQKHEK